MHPASADDPSSLVKAQTGRVLTTLNSDARGRRVMILRWLDRGFPHPRWMAEQ